MESEFLDHISANCEQILLTDPNARLIIAGDINQLKIRDFCNQFNLEQLVKKSTRGHRILDVFLTNNPHLWNVNENHILSYLREPEIIPTYISIFRSKRRGSISAKINIPKAVCSLVSPPYLKD